MSDRECCYHCEGALGDNPVWLETAGEARRGQRGKGFCSWRCLWWIVDERASAEGRLAARIKAVST